MRYPPRRFARSLLIVASLLAVGFPSVASAATWRRLKTDSFVFVGDASESQMKAVARELERFKTVMTLVLPNAATESPVPTVVLVFADDRSFQPYQPRFDGRRVEVAGLFQAGEDVNYLSINGELGAVAVRAVFHEYTHFLVSNTLGPLPIWLNEGLAQFYETVVESKGGRGAIIGATPREHLDTLQQATLIPLTQLMAVERDSPMYNEGSRRGVFYSESWALTHYLALGNPQFKERFSNYLGLVRQAGASEQTFSAAFGVPPSTLEAPLRQYVNNFSFPAIEVTFTGKVDGVVSTRAETIPEAEAMGYLGDMVARLGRVDDARQLLERAAAQAPMVARPVASLGVIELRASHVDEAIRLLEKASMLAPDDPMFAAALGRALIEQGQQGDREARVAVLERARAALDRAVMRDPDTAQTSALLGYVEMALDRNLPDAVTKLARAAALAPARENYRLMLASALMMSLDYEGATRHLGQLMARGSTDNIRAEARQMLTRVAELRNQGAASASAAAAGATPPNGTPEGPATSALRLLNPLAEPLPPSAPPRVILSLRVVGREETRVLGTFVGVECTAGQLLLVVQVDGQAKRLKATTLADVAFVSFRDDTPASVNCGSQPKALRALVTYRAQPSVPGADGTAVALELVPDDFQQR